MSEPAAAPEPSPRRQPSWGRWVIESAMIVFAVLVALAADEWWEERENAELAERAVEAVAAEIRRNRAGLLPEDDDADPSEVVAEINAAIELFDAGETPESFGVTWNVDFLSSAAWETAQATRATQFMDIERVVEIAEVYEFQRFFLARQEEVVTLISDLEGQLKNNPTVSLRTLRGRFGVAAEQRIVLADIYACALADLGAATEEEAAACEATRD